MIPLFGGISKLNIQTVLKRNPVVVALGVLAAVAMMLISEGSHWQSVDTLANLNSIAKARGSIRSLQRSILAAETGQRGYLLTARKEYLTVHDKAIEAIGESFDFLEHYYAQDATATRALTSLHLLTQAKLAELAEAIRLYDLGMSAESTDVVLSELNKRQMDDINTLSQTLLAQQTANESNRHADLRVTLMIRRVAIAAMTAISLLALFLYLRRTAELQTHQLELKRQVQVDRDRLESEVRHRTAQLTELTHHLLSAREDERHRLARDLHDELGSLLTSAKLDAARIKSRLAGTAPEALERLAHLVDTLNSSIALGRRIIEDLRPSTLANLGLESTLEILAREFAETTGVTVHCAIEPVKLDAPAELVVYRLVQEALTNITKYARARQVWITMALRNEQVEVAVRDDGVGFDADAPLRSAYGLMGMRFRVEAAHGTLTLASTPGQGTLVQVQLPQSA